MYGKEEVIGWWRGERAGKYFKSRAEGCRILPSPSYPFKSVNFALIAVGKGKLLTFFFIEETQAASLKAATATLTTSLDPYSFVSEDFKIRQ